MVLCLASFVYLGLITLGIKPGDKIKKGDVLGYFSYGGSTVTTVFEPDRVSLDAFIQEKNAVKANAKFATVREK